MATYSHSPTPSESTLSSSTSHQLIMNHMLSYPGNYEIPLRTMYTLNSTPRAQPLSPQWISTATPTSSAASSPSSIQQMWPDEDSSIESTEQFASAVMAQISYLPTHALSLPPSFITSFVRKCFTSDLTLVDFPQSLTGLDYLKDLETRRRREVVAALSRLGIERDELDSHPEDILHDEPAVTAWVQGIEAKERKIEALYTQIYVALRRWILINELSLTPYNKHNCLAMLNTLYPPAVSSPPTTKLTATILKQQRDGWFRYIQGVERHGPHILSNLMKQGARPGDTHGWPAVCDTLDAYLRIATLIMDECVSVTTAEALDSSTVAKINRKVDSGVSLPSVGVPELDRLGRSSTPSSEYSSTGKDDDALGIGRKSTGDSRRSTDDGRKSTGDSRKSTGDSRPPLPHKPSSALERFARRFRTKRTVSAEAEITPSRTSSNKTSSDRTSSDRASSNAPSEVSTLQLRKMRSAGALTAAKKPQSAGLGAMHARTGSDALANFWHEQMMNDWRRVRDGR